MALRTCSDCKKKVKDFHVCEKKIAKGLPESIIKPSGEGYNPKELSKTLRGLQGNHHLGYNVLNEADRMDRAMKRVPGIYKKVCRHKLRKQLEKRFGKIDWKEKNIN